MKRIKKLKNFILANNMLSIAIPLILVGLLITPLIFHYTEKDINEKNNMIAATIAQGLNDFLDESFIALYQLSDLLDQNVLKDEAATRSYLNATQERSDYIEGLEILDANGVVKHSTPENINILGANRSSQSFFTVPQETQKPYVSTTFISQQTGQPAITLSIPYSGGVLVAYLNLQEISQLSSNLSQAFGDEVTVAITDGNGVFISDKDMNKVYQRDIEENFETIHQDDEKEGQIKTADYDGKNMIVSHFHVNNPDWYVFVYQSADSIFNTIEPILGIIFFCALLLVILSRFIAQIVFKDINQSFRELNQQTREIAAGDYHPIVSGNRFDEFDVLTENFNGMVQSVKDRDQALKILAYYDSQTKLPNAAYLSERLNQLIQKDDGKIALICFDIDNFKRINDTYGPTFGDQVLELMGARLLAQDLTPGFVARINGSNFVRVLTDIHNKTDVLAEVKALRFVFNQAITNNENNVYLRFHVGISLYPDDATSVEELLQYAHTAADVAKQRGKSHQAFFESTMKETFLRNMTLENSLRSALTHHEFYLHYQPQIDVKTQKIRGFEALIRWDHPQLGKIPPLDFIHIAESTGLIVPIGTWVLETACREMVRINEKMGANIIISVNISPVQLNHEYFPEMVEETLKHYGLAPDLLELEITENLFIHSFDEAIRKINRLKAIGIKLSLDDFGTGYSSLAYLRNLPIDTLKIDQAFTRDLLIKKSNEHLMESIIMMAHTLKMDVIVEGVEEAEQYTRLKNFGCDHVQGYFFSRPIDASQLEEYLKKSR